MNLQVVSPYTKCPFRCPYCVSAFEGNYKFNNLYEQDKDMYLSKLKEHLNNRMFDGLVITGLTDPSLFPEWVSDILLILNNQVNTTIKEIVLQTSNYKWINTKGLTVIAYSIGHRNKIDCLPYPKKGVTTRYNIMLSNDLTYEDILYIVAARPEAQYTVKYLSLTSQGHKETDDWIIKNRLELTSQQEVILRKLGVWIDKNCLASDFRYRVFREDGKLYHGWEDLTGA